MSIDGFIPEHSRAYRALCELVGCYMHKGACVNCCAPDTAQEPANG